MVSGEWWVRWCERQRGEGEAIYFHILTSVRNNLKPHTKLLSVDVCYVLKMRIKSIGIYINTHEVRNSKRRQGSPGTLTALAAFWTAGFFAKDSATSAVLSSDNQEGVSLMLANYFESKK